MTPTVMREAICCVLLIPPDQYNWSDYPNIWEEVNTLIDGCEWFKVYDIAEALYSAFRGQYAGTAALFEERLNDYFREHGIGWQMVDGEIVYRGSDTFADATQEAASVLAQTGRSTAASEIHEALADISRRPEPDITGAIQHVIAALECTARDVTGEPNLTLGRLVPRLQLTPPLDSAIAKLWGYASERARHIREGHRVMPAEAELVVIVACAVCTFLAKRD